MRRCKYRYILALILGIIIGSIIYAQPVEESHKTVYSTDSLFSVKISQHWHSGVELNNAANLQIKSKNGDLALIVITESKGDFPIGFSLEEHTQVTTQNMLARLQNGKLSTPTYLDINDNKAIQYRISGTIDDYNLVYVQSTIEGNHHFYQVLAWALKSKIVDYFDEIDDVVESLKIIDKPGQKTTPLPSLSKLMIAEDSSCQIKVPTRWTQYSNLNDNAILQLGSKDEDVFLIVIAENKEDFSGMTLPKYLEVVTGSLATGLKDTLFTKPIQEKVDGSPALQQEISGVFEGSRIAYLFTVIEGDEFYYQVLGWGLQSKFKQHQQLLENILHSFKTSEHVDRYLQNSLWKIETASNSIYLLGSVHILSKSDYPLHPDIQKAFDACQTVYFEVPIDSFDTPTIQQLMQHGGIYGDGKSIEDHISEETYQLFQAKLQNLNLPVDRFKKFKPWFAAITLTATRLQTLGLKGEYGIDQHFYEKAKQDGKQIGALETIPYQLHLFTDMDSKLQELMLVETIKSLGTVESEFTQLLEAWKYGKVDVLEKIVNRHINQMPELREVLLLKRNRNWAQKIEGMTNSAQNVMIIVGVGHLIGEGSVIELLEQKGYEITQL